MREGQSMSLYRFRLDRMTRKELRSEMRRLEKLIAKSNATVGQIVRYQRVKTFMDTFPAPAK